VVVVAVEAAFVASAVFDEPGGLDLSGWGAAEDVYETDCCVSCVSLSSPFHP
jgi:hypothetical protein